MPNESIYIAGPSVRNDPRVQTPILPLAGSGFNGDGSDGSRERQRCCRSHVYLIGFDVGY